MANRWQRASRLHTPRQTANRKTECGADLCTRRKTCGKVKIRATLIPKQMWQTALRGNMPNHVCSQTGTIPTNVIWLHHSAQNTYTTDTAVRTNASSSNVMSEFGLIHRSRYSDYATDWKDRGSDPVRDNTFFSSPKRPDRLWGPPNLLFNGSEVNSMGKAAGTWVWLLTST